MLEITKPKIVITHFPPSTKSIGPQYRDDPTNTYFVNNLDYLIEEIKPQLWVCGHVHHKHSYYIGDTLVVCNPLGYKGELHNKAVGYVPTIVEKDRNGRWTVSSIS
jgi:Icc-related predicted phosphoesterase